MDTKRKEAGGFPIAAGILFGLGLGGFFDGIVLHQVLQWHHMLSGWYPITDMASLQCNTLWDGIFHSGTYVFVVLGLFLLWRSAHHRHLVWSNKLLIGTVLLGFGTFNIVEGVIDHQILGVHRVNETVPESQRFAWDLGFLAWGAAMCAGGWALFDRGGARRSDGRRHDRRRSHGAMGRPWLGSPDRDSAGVAAFRLRLRSNLGPAPGPGLHPTALEVRSRPVVNRVCRAATERSLGTARRRG